MLANNWQAASRLATDWQAWRTSPVVNLRQLVRVDQVSCRDLCKSPLLALDWRSDLQSLMNESAWPGRLPWTVEFVGVRGELLR